MKRIKLWEINVQSIPNILTKFLGSMLLISVIAGCANSSLNEQKEAGQFSVVAITDPDFKPNRGSSVKWSGELYVQDQSSEIKVSENARQKITDYISQGLAQKGFHLVNADVKSDYNLSGLILLGESDVSDVAPHFKVYPQLSKSINQYKEGTLLLALTRRNGPAWRLMWEGAIQVYVVGESLTENERAVRLENIVKRLMDELPRSVN